MALNVPLVGEALALKAFFNTTAGQDQKLDLFATNVTPAETDTAATYTAAAGGGYVQKTMAGVSWSYSGTSPCEASYAQQTWTFTGPLTTNGTIFGYFVTQTTSGILMYSEATTNFTPTNNGDQYLVTPKFTGD